MSNRFHSATGSVIKYGLVILFMSVATYFITIGDDLFKRILVSTLSTLGAVIVVKVFEHSRGS